MVEETNEVEDVVDDFSGITLTSCLRGSGVQIFILALTGKPGCYLPMFNSLCNAESWNTWYAVILSNLITICLNMIMY